MQVFVPFTEPLKTAQCLDKKRLNKQIIECRQLIRTIRGESRSWANHPVTKMYSHPELFKYMQYYVQCLKYYKDGALEMADNYSRMAVGYLEKTQEAKYILSEKFCDQHKRRLYAKDPEHYVQFSSYGSTTENWYYVNGELLVYETDKEKKKSVNKLKKSVNDGQLSLF